MFKNESYDINFREFSFISNIAYKFDRIVNLIVLSFIMPKTSDCATKSIDKLVSSAMIILFLVNGKILNDMINQDFCFRHKL